MTKKVTLSELIEKGLTLKEAAALHEAVYSAAIEGARMPQGEDLDELIAIIRGMRNE